MEEINKLLHSAKEGNASAQSKIAYAYCKGEGIKQDFEQAFHWYKKAAVQGDSYAQYNLGWLYSNGKGVKQNYEQAVHWYKKAADQDNITAQYSLGSAYYHGQGVKQDFKQAFDLCKKVAEKGLANAQYGLGYAYFNGEGVKQDYEQAFRWFKKAADQNDAFAQNSLGYAYSFGKGVEQDSKKAIHWYKKAAEQGESVAQNNLGFAYYIGDGVEQDYDQAIHWYKKAADQGFSESIEGLDLIDRERLSPKLTNLRKEILDLLKYTPENNKFLSHYTSLDVGDLLLLKQSAFRLNIINNMNDPDEGKLLWHWLNKEPVEDKPIFIGCFLPECDNLNMWRFYSKNHLNDDACGCSISFDASKFFDFNLIDKSKDKDSKDNSNEIKDKLSFSNTGETPSESSHFYRIAYVDQNFKFDEENKNAGELKKLFLDLKDEVESFLGERPDIRRMKELSNLLGPLPYLIKSKDYKDEQEHRLIVSHLDYGSKEIKTDKPNFQNGAPAKIYLELHRGNHLEPIKYVTLGPKAPEKDMLKPFWMHELNSQFKNKLSDDFYIKISTCSYK